MRETSEARVSAHNRLALVSGSRVVSEASGNLFGFKKKVDNKYRSTLPFLHRFVLNSGFFSTNSELYYRYCGL